MLAQEIAFPLSCHKNNQHLFSFAQISSTLVFNMSSHAIVVIIKLHITLTFPYITL